MPFKVAAFYQFARLPDFRELREPLRAICAKLQLKGSVLLAHEGINGTLAGELVCASGLAGQCPIPGASYPQQTAVQLLPLQKQATMGNPCLDVPDNPWCNGGVPVFPIPH